MNSIQDIWNLFEDEAQQMIDPEEIISMTTEIIGCRLKSSWLEYVEALRKMAWWSHFATFRDVRTSTLPEH